MPVPVEQIIRERFEEWARLAIECHATPVVLLCVGHDEHSGELHVIAAEGLPSLDLAALLLKAAEGQISP
jgi:hypothetical protein